MFKFGRKDAEHLPPGFAQFTTEVANTDATAQADRRDLLQQISQFLLDHDLDVNPGNLILAQAVCSGSNSDLSRQIMARQLAHEPITQAWLDALTGDIAPLAGFSATAEPRDTLAPATRDPAPEPVPARDNRQAVAALLEQEHRAASATSEPYSIALCDIDRCTAINEAHGEDTGDRVVQAIDRMLQRVSADHCHLARDGGAAFVLLFHGLSPDEAGKELDYARRKFARRKLIDRKTRKTIGSVTFSGGVVDLFGYADAQAALIAAEQLLQTAKDQGRNRIVVASNGA